MRMSTKGVLICLLSAASQAHAEGYYVRWWDVPDYDQMRAEGTFNGQPRNGLCQDGKNYCGPTTATNWFGFIDAHGYPILDTSYNGVTAMIDDTAGHMASGPSTVCGWGTNRGKFDDGLRDQLNEHASTKDKFFTIQANSEGSKYITPGDMALWMFVGGMVSTGVGWYQYDDSSDKYTQVGGHYVGVVEFSDDDDSVWTSRIRVVNPSGSDGDDAVECELLFQSPFKSSAYTARKRWVTIRHQTQLGYDTRYQYEVEGLNSKLCQKFADGTSVCEVRRGFLNHYTALMGATLVGLPSFAAPKIEIILPGALDNSPMNGQAGGGPEGEPQNIWLDLDVPFRSADVIDLQLHPLLPATFVRTGDAVYVFDPMNGARRLVDVGAPGPIATGRWGELFVVEGRTLRLVEDDREVGRATTRRSVTVPGSVDAIAFDEGRARLVVLSGRTLYDYPEDLGAEPRVLSLDRSVPALRTPRLTYDPATAALWVAESGRLTRLSGLSAAASVGAAERVVLDAEVDPRSVGFTDAGAVVAHAGRGIVEWGRDGRGGFAQRASIYSAAGDRVGPLFRVARSRTSAHPDERIEPETPILPEADGRDRKECLADVTDRSGSPFADGVVDEHDLAAFMRAYEARAPRADIDNGSGRAVQDHVVDERDLDLFLAAYDLGCE